MRTIIWQAAANRCNDQIEFFNLASVPCSEDCTPAGRDLQMQKIECTAYMHQLCREYGQEPDGCEFFIIENRHEFGIYYEVGIFYIPAGEEESQSEDFALKCEQGPEYWDQLAKQELKNAGHPKFQDAKILQMKVAV